MSPRALALIAPALLLASCTPPVDVDAERDAIRAQSEQWLAMSRAGDAAGVAALFADDATLLWEDRPLVSGGEAVEAFLVRDFAESGTDGTFRADRIDVAASGDLAVESGTWRGESQEGRYLTVYRKEGDAWKVQADMSLGASPNGGAPAWATTQLATWYELYNARDGEGLSRIYAPDAVVGGTAGARGRAAIARRFRDGWAESDDTCTGAYDDFRMVDDLAVGSGRDVCTTPDGQTTTYRWMSVAERQADGSWLLIRDRGVEMGS
ncbi:MAG TPA: DUF4440 domain-containing protein [Longimicrobiales bacterium]|nr:DUF4440 domain-containing protein [Longimicrobiales bacterium]